MAQVRFLLLLADRDHLPLMTEGDFLLALPGYRGYGATGEESAQGGPGEESYCSAARWGLHEGTQQSIVSRTVHEGDSSLMVTMRP